MAASQSLRILIVDDDPDTRANLCDILELFGYESFGVGSAGEVLALENISDYSVMLLDRRLPDLRAEELLPQLHRLVPETDVVIVTGHADLDNTIAALRLGAADYLLKPVNPEALRLSIERILERKRLRIEKHRSEAAFRQLIESAGSLIAIVRPDHSIAYVNPFVEHISGRTSADVLGRDCFDVFLDSSSGDQVRGAFAAVLGGKPLDDFEVSLHCHNESRRWILCNARRLDDYDGEPAVLFIGQDVTARREAEQGLYLLDAAIANLEEGMIITKIADDWFSSKIVYVNGATSRMMGYSAEDLTGSSPRIFRSAHTDRFVVEQLDDALVEGRAFTCESICQRQDRSEFPAELHLCPVFDPQGRRTHTVAVIRDITERRRAEERLLQAERLAAIGKAMTGLAHESRNALQRAQASLDVLAVDLEGNDQARKLIRRIQTAQDDLHRLYEDVREYARPIRIEPHAHRIDDLLRQAWEELIVKRAHRDAQLRESNRASKLTCDVEAFAIRQVFRNILDNALAACDGEVLIDVGWSDAVLRGQPALQVSIRDNGPGVTGEQRDRIFDEFFTTKTHGTGLGLAISKRFIDAHGGTISVGPNGPPGLEIVITLLRDVG